MSAVLFWLVSCCERRGITADIRITRTDARDFDVEEGETQTSHHVTVPQGLIDELGLPEDDLEAVVRESIAFLLEREPASSILPEFSLDVIPDYFPEYKEELPGRL